ncbi:MAG: hypothetical protein FD143_2797 [Ignavibacteria bacterium]|nr:MAG: hypothetical protein FD143_2797 [Ignavibacteria bacterium]KAF0158296.1 MAG: hypothetical protein FD188_2554 [Ignavibacteria bacterium]
MKKVRVVLLPFFLFAVLVVNFLLLPKNIEAAREPAGCTNFDCYGGPKNCATIHLGGGEYGFCHKYDDIIAR